MGIKLARTPFFFSVFTLIIALGVVNLLGTSEESLPEMALPLEPCSMDNNTWQDGEEIVYKIYYNWNFVWLAAGEVVFRVKEKDNHYHLSAKGRTYKSYEWFYKVRDNYDTYVDKETLLPNVSVRDIMEGKYRLYDEITFDRDRNIAVSLRGKSKEIAKITEYDVSACMHDLLSIMYYTRNIDYNELEVGTNIPIEIFMDKESWPLKVKYLGKETRKKIRNRGHFDTIKFTPEVILGDIFNEKSKMMVWASDDKNRIPLMIESPISVGSVKVVMKSYKGLRHEFTAQSGKKSEYKD